MKCAIFCTLAFCAFQTVFANDSAEDGIGAINGDDETANKLAEHLGKLQRLEESFWKAADSVKPKGKGAEEVTALIGNCLMQGDSPTQKLANHYNTASSTCNKCYDKVKKTKNNELAGKCCDKAIAAFEKAEKLHFDLGMACVAKCSKLGDDCLQMLKKLPVDKTGM